MASLDCTRRKQKAALEVQMAAARPLLGQPAVRCVGAGLGLGCVQSWSGSILSCWPELNLD